MQCLPGEPASPDAPSRHGHSSPRSTAELSWGPGASIARARAGLSATASWPCLLDKNPFHLHGLEKTFSGARLWCRLLWDHSNTDRRGDFLSWHPSSSRKHLPEKSRVTHRTLGKERANPAECCSQAQAQS